MGRPFRLLAVLVLWVALASATVAAVPQPGVGVVAGLLLGLVGGVVGGCAVLAGWATVTRRRPRQPASAT
jgi:hypothetical protein